MEAKVTSTRKLEVYPSKHNKEIETAETIFIEDILKLKNEGDSILLTRRNASGLSCLAYLESRPVEKLVSGKFLEVMKIFRWLLGYTDFPARKETEKGAYYWRTHLRKKLYRIGINQKMIEDKKFSS